MTAPKGNNEQALAVSRADATMQVSALMEMRATSGVPLAMVQTYGCQQNVADGEKIKGQLAEMGFAFTDNPEEADFILFNTCAVRENAEVKVFGKVGELKHLKEKKPSLITALCGCMVEQEHIINKIKKSYPYLDLVFGTHVIHKLPQLLNAVLTNGGRVYEWGDKGLDADMAEEVPIARDETKVGAYLTIMYGCNNFCTYCVVPYVRGREKSRTPESIEAEFIRLVEAGYKEITLLGQNVNSYGKTLETPMTFAALLRRLDAVPGDYRIRFMSSHPKDATRELIDTMASGTHICHSFHLPIQAGNNRVLKAMNRGYTKESYLDLVDYAKSKIPNITFTTDLIVGFPGETYEEFLDTIDVVEQVGFHAMYTFIYSPRIGTSATKLSDPVPAQVKSKWFKELWAAQEKSLAKRSPKMIGKKERVLVYMKSEKTGLLVGKTDGNMNFEFEGDSRLIGTTVTAHIESSKNFVLKGTVVNN